MTDESPGLPLSELDSIDWSALDIRSGPATDVGKYLRTVASADADTGLRALDWLDDQLLHRGAVFSATPKAAPFVVTLASKDYVTRLRVRIVRLLRMIATGLGYNERFEEEFAAQGDDVANDQEFQADKPVQARWAEEGRQAVAAAQPLLRDILCHDDPALRIEAATTLAAVAVNSQPAMDALKERLQVEADDAVRATMVLALHRVGGIASHPPTDGPLTRWAANVCSLRELEDRELDLVVQAVLEMAFDDRLSQLPYVDAYGMGPLDVVGVIGSERAVDAMLGLLDHPQVDAGLLVTRLLGLAVDGAGKLHRDPPKSPPFTPLERRVLQAIVDWDHWWTLPLAATTLGRYVTPSQRDDLRTTLSD